MQLIENLVSHNVTNLLIMANKSKIWTYVESILTFASKTNVLEYRFSSVFHKISILYEHNLLRYFVIHKDLEKTFFIRFARMFISFWPFFRSM